MKHNSKTYFISAARPNMTPSVLLDRHLELGSKLSKLGYNKTEVIGCYNGQVEMSFAVSSVNNNTERDIVELAKEYEQEAILIVHGIDSTAELVFIKDTKRKDIGIMTCIGGEDGTTTEPLKGRDYSFINGRYYIVKEF